MLLTVYKQPTVKKVVVLPDDEDLTEFMAWALKNKIWYTTSRTVEDIEWYIVSSG